MLNVSYLLCRSNLETLLLRDLSLYMKDYDRDQGFPKAQLCEQLPSQFTEILCNVQFWLQDRLSLTSSKEWLKNFYYLLVETKISSCRLSSHRSNKYKPAVRQKM